MSVGVRSLVVVALVGVACTKHETPSEPIAATPSPDLPRSEPEEPPAKAETGSTEQAETGSTELANDPLEAAKARAHDALRAERPKGEINVHTLDGPDGTVFVRAADPKAYPGSGVAALVYDPRAQATHGRRGEHSLAQLMRSRGWFDERLPDAVLIRLAHQAHFDGILILEGATVESTDDGLRVILPAHTMSGSPDRTWWVDIPRVGDDVVRRAEP